MKIQIILSSILALSACATAPVVSDFNGSSVKIQTSAFTSVNEAKASSQAEANRICGKVGKHAEYASTSAAANYVSEHLYLCL